MDRSPVPAALCGRSMQAARALLFSAAISVAPASLLIDSAQSVAHIAGGVSVVKSCTAASLVSAVAKSGMIRFACSGSISLTAPLEIRRGSTTLDASGQTVTLTGTRAGTSTRLVIVRAGSTLTLVDLSLSGAVLRARDGKIGTDGSPGSAGANAPSNVPGLAGRPGRAGTGGGVGTNGLPAQGAAMEIGRGATVIIEGCAFRNDMAAGGNGGRGGNGGTGGNGGAGGAGLTGLSGGPGGPGGAAGLGGDGAEGGTGGAAEGGAIYNNGHLVITGSTFDTDAATGGMGGSGGSGGTALLSLLSGDVFHGGTGGAGGSASGPTGTGGKGGAGGAGGAGGDEGAAGGGGLGVGGAIYNAGTLAITGSSFSGDRAVGGGGVGSLAFGAYGGAGGDDGSGGTTANPSEIGGGPGGPGGVAGPGGDGDAGGAGGTALGGAIYSDGSLHLSATKFISDTASGGGASQGGNGGDGGPGGEGGNAGSIAAGGDGGASGDGGDGGNGGNGGSAVGGAVLSVAAVQETGLRFSANAVTGGLASTGKANGGSYYGEPGGGGSGAPLGKPGASGDTGDPGRLGRPGVHLAKNLYANYGIVIQPLRTAPGGTAGSVSA